MIILPTSNPKVELEILNDNHSYLFFLRHMETKEIKSITCDIQKFVNGLVKERFKDGATAL